MRIYKLRENEKDSEEDTIQWLVRSSIERDFLNICKPGQIFQNSKLETEQGWFRLTHLPVSSMDDKEYAVYPRWQNTIAALHAMKCKMCYVLLRKDCETQLYMGAIPTTPGDTGKKAQEQFAQALSTQMPGIGLELRSDWIVQELIGMKCCGAVTGVPSIRKANKYGQYQTLDHLVRGIHDHNGEQDYAVVIIAEPVGDKQIMKTLRSMQDLGSEIHALTQASKSSSANYAYTISAGETNSSSIDVGLKAGGKLAGLIDANLDFEGNSSSSISFNEEMNISGSESVSVQYIQKSAIYCEEIIDKHIARLKAGRNLGFWKTGVYVLAESDCTVQTAMTMLRAAYSGDDSYIEPIRITTLPANSGASDSVIRCQILKYPCKGTSAVLGDIYEDYATPITTEELSIVASLPQCDVPGIRQMQGTSWSAVNSQVMNQLVKHAFIAGTDESGKTHTSKRLLEQLQDERIPFLVIEPTKTEYMEWAAKENRHRKKKILIFAPGFWGKDNISELKINPFQPAGTPGTPLNMISHIDRIKSVLLKLMPTDDVLSLVMENVLYQLADEMDVKDFSLFGGKSPTDGPFLDDHRLHFPLIENMYKSVEKVLCELGYDEQSRGKIVSAVRTRTRALSWGWKKILFNSERSTDYCELFEKNDVIINLSCLTDHRDKAFAMAILLIALWEFRESKYMRDKSYKENADQGKLMHLTLLEDAHFIMGNGLEEEGDRKSHGAVSKLFGDMLSEIRSYGEGMVVVDPIPSRLISTVIKNTNLKIIHRMTAQDDIEAISEGMKLCQNQKKRISELQPGEAIIYSEFDDRAAWIKVD